MVAQAVRLGAESLEVEYKDGFEEVFAMRGGMNGPGYEAAVNSMKRVAARPLILSRVIAVLPGANPRLKRTPLVPPEQP